MTAHLAHIVRHPIKAVGWEEVTKADLAIGQGLLGDRRWAVAHEAARLEAGVWGPKQNFLRGVSAAELMAVRARLDEKNRITLSHPQRDDISVVMTNPSERDALVAWLQPLWPDNRPAPRSIIEAGDQPFTDIPTPHVSLLNLASNRTLGQRLGRDLSIHRWRGNLWVNGLAPWEEFDLIDRHLRIGQAELKIEMRITRCCATCGNPETGKVDADTLGALSDGYGHEDFGVYARVVKGGAIAKGDAVIVL